MANITFVNVSLGVMRFLVFLVDDGILGGGCSTGQASIRVLSDILVGLLGSLGSSALNRLLDVVCGVLK